MEFVRQIVNGNALKPVITLPPSFHNVQVEVIVLPVENRKSGPDISTKPVRHSAFGRLKAHANPSLISEEKGAWEKRQRKNMLYIDTNIILRYVLDDHAELSPKAKRLIEDNIVETPIETLMDKNTAVKNLDLRYFY